MKIYTAILVAFVWTICGSLAGADMLSGFAGKSSLRYFDLQRELTGGDVRVPEMQKEMLLEVPAGFVPSKQDFKRPRSSGPETPASDPDIQRGLI